MDATNSLTRVERALIDHVARGEILDLTNDEPVDNNNSTRSSPQSRTVRAWVIRDIMRGRLAANVDPHGLRLRGAQITGRLDLDNITTTTSLTLDTCLLLEGISLRDAHLTTLRVTACRLEHLTESPLYASRLTTALLDIRNTTIRGRDTRGAIVLVGAHIGLMNCAGAIVHNESGPALSLAGLNVERSLILSNGFFHAKSTGDQGAVELNSSHIGGQFNCSNTTIHNDSGPALDARGLHVDQAVFLNNRFRAVGTDPRGTVLFNAGHIGSQFDCSDATIHNDSGPALDLRALRVDNSVFLRGNLQVRGTGANGAIRLTGTHIGGQLDCSDANVHNNSGSAFAGRGLRVDKSVLFRGSFEVVGSGDGVTLDLNDARIGGTLTFAPARLEHLTNPQTRLSINGLIYTGLPEGISCREWLQLLQEGTPAYAAQPYQHLASAHRAAGHDGDARRILITQRRNQIRRRALTRRSERAWAGLTGLLLGYGYQTWRALLALLLVIIAAVVLALALGQHGGLARPQPSTMASTSPSAPIACTVVEQIGAGVDLGTPLITAGSRTRCDTTNSATGTALTLTGWALRLLAWAFATLFIAGFTSAVRKT